MIEYLVVATAVILGILAVRGLIQPKVTGLGTAAAGKIDATSGTIGSEVTPVKR